MAGQVAPRMLLTPRVHRKTRDTLLLQSLVQPDREQYIRSLRLPVRYPTVISIRSILCKNWWEIGRALLFLRDIFARQVVVRESHWTDAMAQTGQVDHTRLTWGARLGRFGQLWHEQTRQEEVTNMACSELAFDILFCRDTALGHHARVIDDDIQAIG